jgi:hypothetical protein
LEDGETWTYTCSFTVPAHTAGEEDPIVNTATVTGEDLDGDAVGSDSDTHSVDILHREGTLTLNKNGPATAFHGNTIIYSYVVTYTPGFDGSPAQNIVPTDDKCSPVAGPTGDDGDGLLEQGETWLYICSFTVPAHAAGEEDPIVNTATVTGEDLDGDAVGSDTDTHSVDILHDAGALSIDKTGPATAFHGDTITYTYRVTFTPGGDGSPAMDVTVTDDKCAPITGPTGDDGDGLLEAGETWTYTCSFTVPAHTSGEEDPIVNTATVTGTDTEGDLVGSDSDTHSVDILHREGTLTVDKTGPATAFHGDTIIYSYAVTYTPGSDGSPAQNILVTDDKCSPLTGPSGDNGNGLLEAGETWTYTCSFTVPAHTAGEEDPIINTATVTGEDLDGDAVGSDSDTHSVDILHREGTLTVDKTGPATAFHGDTFVYSYAVTYTPGSDGSPARDIVVTDDKCAPVTGPSGDDGDGLLEDGETWTYTCSFTVPAHTTGEEDPIVNTATVTGEDLDGDAVGSDSDTHSVDILHREGTLTVDKTGPATAFHSDTIIYSYAVTYTPGSDGSPAQNIVLSDDKCSPVTGPTGDDGDGLLEASETWMYTCSFTVPAHAAGEEDPIVNTATVTGEDLDGDAVGSDSDTHSLDILHREGTLTVNKTGPATAFHGDTIIYSYAVTYTPGSDGSPARDIVLTDDKCSPVTGPTGDDGDGLLEGGETWMYTCSFTVPAHAAGEEDSIVNTATVTGQDLDGDAVGSDTDTHSVDILHREGTLTVNKNGPATAFHGNTIIYSYAVTYTPGSDGSPARDIVVTDDKCSPVTGPTGDDGDGLLETGETWMYTCSFTVPAHAAGEEDPIVNTATVTGKDLDGDAVGSDTATHSLDILHREGTLTVDKAGPATAFHGDTIIYSYAVTYTPGSDGSPARDIVLTDDKCSPVTGPTGDDGDGLLETGETWMYTCSFTVPAHAAGEADPIVNTATVTADDLDGDAVGSDTDTLSLDILHREGTLTVDKTGPTKAFHGDTIIYSYAVTYTSGSDGSPARDIVLTDDKCSAVSGPSGDDGDGLLEAGETWNYSCSFAVPTHSAGEVDPIVNTATVTGNDLDVNTVGSDTDTWSVDILHELVPFVTRDDGDLGYQEVGIWTEGSGGFVGLNRADPGADHRIQSAGIGKQRATWSLSVTGGLPAGMYQVYITWVAKPTNTTAAPYTIYDNNVLEAAPTRNQRLEPDDGTFKGRPWESLGTYTITNGTVRVRLTDATNDGNVIADGVLLVRISPLTLQNESASGGVPLTPPDLQPLVNEAIARWTAAGADANELDTVQFSIADLPDSYLGWALSSYQSPGHSAVIIDANATGHGWFIDTSPATDVEFSRGTGHVLSADTANTAADGVDLLTVVIHELGHILGLEHNSHGVMQESLAAGTRSLPELGSPVTGNFDQRIPAAVLTSPSAPAILPTVNAMARHAESAGQQGVTFDHLAPLQWAANSYSVGEPVRSPLASSVRFRALHDRSAILDHVLSGYTLTGAQGKLLEPCEMLLATSKSPQSDRHLPFANRRHHNLVDRTLDSIVTEVRRQGVIDDLPDSSIWSSRTHDSTRNDRAVAVFFLLPVLAGVGERLSGKAKEASDRHQRLETETRERTSGNCRRLD